MHVYKRPESPFWMMDIVKPDGTRLRKSTKTKNKGEAQAKAFKLLADLKADAEGPRRITIAAALEDYAASLASHGRSSAKEVMALGRKTLGSNPNMAGRFHLDGERTIDTITPMDLERLINARMSEGNGPQTIAHELKNLRAAVRRATGLAFRGPTLQSWRLPRLSMKTRYLSWEEFLRVYEHLSPARTLSYTTRSGGQSATYSLDGEIKRGRQDAQDLLVALTMCGGRWSEVAALRWAQIDTEDWTAATLYATKAEKERLVPIPAAFREVLERRLKERDLNQPLVFPGRSGAQRGATCKAIGRALAACGLNDEATVRRHGRATIHSLRHTFASWAIQTGKVSIAEVGKALGHVTLNMTMRYAHLEQAETVAKIGGALSKMGGGGGEK